MIGQKARALLDGRLGPTLWNTPIMEVPMAFAYLEKRLARSTLVLSVHLGNLRERLVDAYQEGFATVTVREMAVFGHDIQNQFASLRNKLTSVRDGDFPNYHASVAAMSNEEVASAANSMMDIKSSVAEAIASGRVIQ